MPGLKDLQCQVLWANTSSAFPEYGTQYGDGVVETYIAVPKHPQGFTIRLTSRKFIYEGLAMIVFIDGEYQCNRNRIHLKPLKKNTRTSEYVVDFLVRQKEKPLGDETYMGREWRFDDFNIVSEMPEDVDESHFRELGTIEVIVLRCKMSDAEDNMSSTSSGEDSELLGSRIHIDGETKYGSEHASEEVKSPEPETEADIFFAGLPGAFDGPHDEYAPSYRGYQGDAPPNGHPGWGYYSSRGQPARYEPPEAASYPQNYHTNPVYHYPSESPQAYRASPLTPSYGSHPYRSQRPERRVHFDLGDGRGPQQHRRMDSDMRYDDRPRYHGPDAWREEHEYYRSAPEPAYRQRSHQRGPSSYSDYPPGPSDRHYMYDAEQKSYGYYPEVNLPDSHPTQAQPVNPFMAPHVNRAPSFPATHIQQQATRIPMPAQTPVAIPASHTQQQPTGIQIPGPAPVSFPVPPPSAPPPPFPAPPWATATQQAVQVPVPVWFGPPTDPAQPPFPGPVPVYPPPNNAPLFHTRGPHPIALVVPPVSTATTSEPGPAVSQPDAGTARKPATQDKAGGSTEGKDGQDPSKDANDKTAQDKTNKDALDPPKDETDKGASNDGWGDNVATKIDNEKDTTANADKDWAAGADPTPSGNEQTFNNDETNDYDNNDANNDAAGWANDNANGDSGNKQSEGGWANDANANSNGNKESTGNAGQPSKRILYGPHGPYYTTKAAVETVLTPDAEEEPRYDVPRAITEKMGISKQVQPGPGYLYSKKRRVPEYIDSLQEPYARFVFKYRTKDQIKKEIGVEVHHEPTPDEDANQLETMGKAELIELVLRAKGALGGKIPSPPAKVATPALTQSHGQVPVVAPDVGFLSYKLPPGRKVSEHTGLGIKSGTASNNGKASGETEQQNAGWDSGAPGWAEAGNEQQVDTNTGQGWDGQMDERDSASFKIGSFGELERSQGGRSEVQDQDESRAMEEASKKITFQASGVVQPAIHAHAGISVDTRRDAVTPSYMFVPENTSYLWVPGSAFMPAETPQRGMQADPSMRSYSSMPGYPAMQAHSPTPFHIDTPIAMHPWAQGDASRAPNSPMPRESTYPWMQAPPSRPRHTPIPPYQGAQANVSMQTNQSAPPNPSLPTHSRMQPIVPVSGYVPISAANPAYPTPQANPSMPAYPSSIPTNSAAADHRPWSTASAAIPAPSQPAATNPSLPTDGPWTQAVAATSAARGMRTTTVPPPHLAAGSTSTLVMPVHPIYAPATAAQAVETQIQEDPFLEDRPLRSAAPRPLTPPSNADGEPGLPSQSVSDVYESMEGGCWDGWLYEDE